MSRLAPLLLLLVIAPARGAAEKWADETLPAREGLALWLDATRQIEAWEAHGKGLVGGEPVDVFYDASGSRRDLVQPLRDAQPKFLTSQKQAAIRFDGKDDHLRFAASRNATLEQFTVFIVACPRSNKGGFRCFLSASETGKSDWATGLNVDLGPKPTTDTLGAGTLNVEGSGFTGVKSLIGWPLMFEDFCVIGLGGGAPGPEGITASVNGNPTGKRERTPGKVHIDNIVLGARCLSNEDTPPYLQGFLDGDIAEVLIYDRLLSAGERTSVETYLVKKHENAGDGLNRGGAKGQALTRVEKAPDVQVFVPGFVTRPLPLDLTNINNIRYREDGKLVAVAYDGRIYLLSDTDGDGLEDQADLFFDGREKLVSPIGIALTPPNYPCGRGVFVPCKGKLALIVDTDGDDKANKEITVADGWKLTFHQVDTLGVALDKENNVYFGLGTSNFADPLLKDDKGVAHYDLKSERGTIVKVSPDFSRREIVCTGIRFSVGLAFNRLGDLFCTDQEGATWCPNGNPFDELLHIQPGRHYGFPPRHPKHLPNVIDEPSTFDYIPQHQSTCGLVFNDPVNGGPTFGPASWAADALVCGESRGKLYRTKLAKTAAGYIARNELWASMPMLAIDSCISPTGDLVVAAHSGNPDWGTGPAGKGKLYKISYAQKDHPQPVLCWAAGPGEVRVAFDRPLDPASLAQWSSQAKIDFGRYVGAGDRFETMRPGYAAIKRQIRATRDSLAVASVQFTPDRRTLVLSTAPQRDALSYALTLPGFNRPSMTGAVQQHNQIDLAYDLTGVAAEWKSADGKSLWSGWLPHPDLSVSRTFTAGSAEHDALWSMIKHPGTLRLRCNLDLANMLRPEVQPGSQVDFTLPPEAVTLAFVSNTRIDVSAKRQAAADGKINVTPRAGELLPVEIRVHTGDGEPSLNVTFTTNEDSLPRPLALRRFLVPWAKLPSDADAEAVAAEPIAQLKGGDWLRGREIFFGNEAACYKCHAVRGRGSDLGPDLSNLIHRDYDSVMRDITNPSGALNPDYIGSMVKLNDGRMLAGIVRNVDGDHFRVRGDAEGEKSPIARSQVKKITASPISVMPTGVAEGLGEAKMRDLMTYLLTEPLSPAPIERKGAPPPRTRAEVEAVMTSISPSATASSKPLNVLLVAGPKDHGPSEHDYPAWQKRWTTLLGLAEGVKVEQAAGWPTAEQWQSARVAVFFSANAGWSEQRAKELDAFLARGGGMVFIHWAVNGHAAGDALAQRIGLAAKGPIRYRHGAFDLVFRDTAHPITRGFERVHFLDETYWNLAGDPKRIHLLADAVEDGQPRPQLWTMDHSPGRVFVCIPGHYTWTFDDPLYRLLVLRGICWSAGEEADRLSNLATLSARMRN